MKIWVPDKYWKMSSGPWFNYTLCSRFILGCGQVNIICRYWVAKQINQSLGPLCSHRVQSEFQSYFGLRLHWIQVSSFSYSLHYWLSEVREVQKFKFSLTPPSNSFTIYLSMKAWARTGGTSQKALFKFKVLDTVTVTALDVRYQLFTT